MFLQTTSENFIANPPDRIGDAFLQDVIQGLSRPQKTLPAKYFYDLEGSGYFDQICRLEEYYPCRTEMALLPTVAAELREMFTGSMEEGLNVVEFGAGSLQKIALISEAIPFFRRYIPIDICEAHLRASARFLMKQHPHLEVHPLVADFTDEISLPELPGRSMGFFPGSTIGNFFPDEAIGFLRRVREALGHNNYLLIGVDTKKDPAILHSAYNDQLGVTARFNKNILARINRELDGDFDLSRFAHKAWYNETLGRVEMHLRSQVNQSVHVGMERFYFREGETIHTECAYKYHPDEFARLAAMAGWITVKRWMAADDLFSVFLLGCPTA